MPFRRSALLLLLAACGGGSATYSELKTRASFDMKCERANLKVTPLGDDVAGVQGCGQQATYVERCMTQYPGAYRSCSWVMDAARGPGQAAPAR
jgi:hypothetical protein